ncbi:MAG: asparagine--tRNA ligase [Bacteroidia bacterium]|nr:asparagine--tRNA ligase [Bacteroidia bacterium]MDW8157926.1 asparagine--tRNA ligase [Bacteroidia bacterium]
MKRTKIKDIFFNPVIDSEYTVCGWVKTRRSSKKVSFVEINDGSGPQNLQVVVDNALVEAETLKKITTGTAVRISGMVVKSVGIEQPIEMQARRIEILGEADAETYPLQKKAHSYEFLREIAHLRFRTGIFGSIFRIRSAIAFAIHKFFQERGFFYLHTPIITGADCEGAGAMFQVTTLPLNTVPMQNGKPDFGQDFFGKPTHLTVSGQLNAELAAMGLSEVYTFGPTFRAENSNTSRHLAEFWMIEPEMAFYELEENIQLAEDLLKYLLQYALQNCREDLEYLQKHVEDNDDLIETIQKVAEADFIRLEYTEAIEILKNSGVNFEFPVAWGCDLQSEHERYLVEKHFAKPVIVINYPKEIKAFYMRLNEDGKTVRAMDILFPGIGEIIGGSQREERYDKLLRRIHELGLPEAEYWWYLDTRKFGSVPHSGFGLGFERLLLFITGMSNIRDVIPFPRTPGNAEF